MQGFTILHQVDPETASAICRELRRQVYRLEMIASENFTSPAVLVAQGSVMTNKYAEGYPARRYYGGCEYVDEVEQLAIERAKKLFSCEHANVQPHSGSQANMAVYLSLLKPGDTVLGMDLKHGGHLTHGSPVNFSGILFNFVPYGVSKETEVVNYKELRDLAKLHRPRLIVVGASAYPRTLHFDRFLEIAKEVGAILVADIAHIAGLVAAGVHPNPFPHCDIATTTTHKTLRGPRGGMILCKSEFSNRIDKAVFPGIQGGPLMHVIAAKAVCFKEALSDDFRKYQKQIVINAKCLAEELLRLGYRLVSGGTDNHLLLIDLHPQGVTGKAAEEALQKAGITVNKNTIPFDDRSPYITSGIRIGTSSLTSRGMKEYEMKEIARLINDVLVNIEDEEEILSVAQRVRELCEQFPIYKEELNFCERVIGGEGIL